MNEFISWLMLGLSAVTCVAVIVSSVRIRKRGNAKRIEQTKSKGGFYAVVSPWADRDDDEGDDK